MASGSVRERQDRPKKPWEVVVRLPPVVDPATGKKTYPQRSRSFDTEREAERALRRWLVEIEAGEAVDRTPLTVGAWLQRWLDDYVRPTRHAKTLESYEITIRVHITPHIGGLGLQALTTDRVQRLYADLLTAGVGRRSIELVHLRLRQAYNAALRAGLVARNPAALATPPRAQAREMVIWSVEEQRRFLAAAESAVLGRGPLGSKTARIGSRFGPLWHVALSTGMRRGELLGLRWRDVGWTERTLHVRQSVTQIRGKRVFGALKGGKRRRDVAISDHIISVLRAHQKEQQQRRAALGDAWEQHDLVFPNEYGAPAHAQSLRRDYDRLTVAAGVPRIRINDTRHTHISHALAAGADIMAVSERAGHSRHSITWDIYGHRVATQRAEVVDRYDALLFGPPPTTLDEGATPEAPGKATAPDPPPEV